MRGIVLILLLGGFLRFFHLSSVPTELVVDEIDLYNSARSIVTTGHDVDGSLEPFLYARFVRNPPVYAVAGYASSLIFGKTPFGLRLPAALFGLISILLVYAIARELTQRESIALLAALVQAVAPIFVQFSRTAWEPSCELPFLLGGIYCMLLAIRESTPLRLFGAAFLFALTAYTYMAGWFYALVLGGPLLAIYLLRERSWERASRTFAAAALWFLVAMPALRMWFFDGQTFGRTIGMATFGHGVSLASLRTFTLNYLSHFRWSYLVTTGDPQSGTTWRYLNGFGAFYWWVIPLAAIGIFATFAYVRSRALAFWVWLWLAAYPLGGALTNDGAPNAPRTLAGAPVFCLLAAMGLMVLFDGARAIRWRRFGAALDFVLAAAFAVSVTASVVLFARFYFTQYVHRNSNAWASGTHALFDDLLALRTGYARICFNIHPEWYDSDSYARFYLTGSGLQWIDNIGNPLCYRPGTLIATDPNDPVARAGFAPISTILDVDGNKFAYVIGYSHRQAPGRVHVPGITKSRSSG
ncbi:MAG TPA: glycosyltransferase family 39 protein [Candidatus Acidoferrales bacterium]|nr:glycosyltransferase family 39 protein [Candidatus Acidoferrales bacterium]